MKMKEFFRKYLTHSGKYSEVDYVEIQTFDNKPEAYYTGDHIKIWVNENGRTKEFEMSEKAMRTLCDLWFRTNGHA